MMPGLSFTVNKCIVLLDCIAQSLYILANFAFQSPVPMVMYFWGLGHVFFQSFIEGLYDRCFGGFAAILMEIVLLLMDG